MRKFLIILLILLTVGCGKNDVTEENKRGNDESNSQETTSSVSSNSNVTSNVQTKDYDKTLVGKNKVTLTLFYSSTCNHCHEEIEWLDSIASSYPYLTINKYEASENIDFYTLTKEKMKIDSEYVPLTIIGNEYRIGYSSASNSELISLIEELSTRSNCDAVSVVKANGDVAACMKQNENK